MYLQAGRIAWATDSRHRFAFASHLQSIAHIEPDTLRQVVEECRRERLPLGETLVQWGLATWEAVRTALSHQISLAVSQLAQMETAQTLFLERTFPPYDDRLTFQVSEFAPAPPASTEDASESGPAASSTTGTRGLARQLRASIEGLSWVEVLDGDRVIDGDPGCPSSRVPVELVRTSVLDGCDFVAIRSARSSVVGLGVAARRSIWCRLSADSTFGSVVSAIWAAAGVPCKSFTGGPPHAGGAAWSLGAAGAAANETLRAFQQRAQEVLAAIVLDGTTLEPMAGSGSGPLAPERCLDLARRRLRSLAAETLPLTDPGEHELDAIGFSMKTLVSGEDTLWCFGAELEHGASLWVFVDRRTSQGLGWAYLSALTRTLARERAAGP